MTEPYQDKETLERLYWDEQMSQTDIVEEFGVAQRTVGYWMEEHAIETRGQSEAQRLRHSDSGQKQLEAYE